MMYFPNVLNFFLIDQDLISYAHLSRWKTWLIVSCDAEEQDLFNIRRLTL